MGEALVRAVLWEHLLQRHPGNAPTMDDPNALLPAEELRGRLEQVQRDQGDNALRQLAHDYVLLWSRTFRTLVRHLRGRPERTLSLFCDEVYPFLRGDHRAARILSRDRHQARIVVADDLPSPYVAGLVEAFMALSGAEANARVARPGIIDLDHRMHPRDAAARTVAWLAGLRIPLLVTAALAVLLGAAVVPPSSLQQWVFVGLLAIGSVAAQSAANALHDLRARPMGPLAVPRTGPGWRWFQAGGSAVVAIGCLTTLMAFGHIWLIAFAVVGMVLGVSYARLRDRGLGPFIAVLSQGPLIVAATIWVLAQPPQYVGWLSALLVGLVPGLLTAAMLYIDDLADRPIDQAAGRRTMAVRLPQRRNLVAFMALVSTGVLLAAFVVSWRSPLNTIWLLPSLGLAIALGLEVRRNLDDPRGLARARVVAFGMHIVTTLTLSLLLLTTEAFLP